MKKTESRQAGALLLGKTRGEPGLGSWKARVAQDGVEVLVDKILDAGRQASGSSKAAFFIAGGLVLAAGGAILVLGGATVGAVGAVTAGSSMFGFGKALAVGGAVTLVVDVDPDGIADSYDAMPSPFGVSVMVLEPFVTPETKEYLEGLKYYEETKSYYFQYDVLDMPSRHKGQSDQNGVDQSAGGGTGGNATDGDDTDPGGGKGSDL